MSFEHWLAFAAASALLLAIPGPTVLLVVSYALGYGRRAAWATTSGVALGDFTSMSASMLGLGVVLAASAALFTALKWIGAAYLIYLGIKLWRAPVGTAETPVEPIRRGAKSIFLHTYAVTTLNPKSIIFFIAFLPQFIVANAPLGPQIVIVESTFVILGALNAFGYAWLAAAARRTIRQPRVQRIVNRSGGSLLIGAGLLAVAWKRSAG